MFLTQIERPEGIVEFRIWLTFVSVKPVYRKKIIIISILYLAKIYFSYTEHNGWNLTLILLTWKIW